MAHGTARVTNINVRNIGLGGGTIVIEGEGFATDGFSQFDPNKGNKVRKINHKFMIFIPFEILGYLLK